MQQELVWPIQVFGAVNKRGRDGGSESVTERNCAGILAQEADGSVQTKLDG